MDLHTYRVDWWYRHDSDTDRSLRAGWQMTSGISSAFDLTRELANMRMAGYTIQRVRVQPICPTCNGNARVAVRTFKRAPTKYADCPVCQGSGLVASPLDWPINSL